MAAQRRKHHDFVQERLAEFGADQAGSDEVAVAHRDAACGVIRTIDRAPRVQLAAVVGVRIDVDRAGVRGIEQLDEVGVVLDTCRPEFRTNALGTHLRGQRRNGPPAAQASVGRRRIHALRAHVSIVAGWEWSGEV